MRTAARGEIGEAVLRCEERQRSVWLGNRSSGGQRQAGGGLEGSDPFGDRLKQRDETSFLINIRAAILLTIKPGGFS